MQPGPLEEPYRVVNLGDSLLASQLDFNRCPSYDGKYIDPDSCSIPPFSYVYPENSVSPREGSAFVCTAWVNQNQPDQYVETFLHGIAISQPITNSDTNYIGKFFRIPVNLTVLY